MTDTKHERINEQEPPRQSHSRYSDRGIKGWFIRHKPVLAYILLAVTVAWSLAAVTRESSARRTDLASSSRQVVIIGCERDNETRMILRDIIRKSNAQIAQYIKDGTITEEQAKRALEANQKAIKALPSADCEKIADTIATKEEINANAK